MAVRTGRPRLNITASERWPLTMTLDAQQQQLLQRDSKLIDLRALTLKYLIFVVIHFILAFTSSLSYFGFAFR